MRSLKKMAVKKLSDFEISKKRWSGVTRLVTEAQKPVYIKSSKSSAEKGVDGPLLNICKM